MSSHDWILPFIVGVTLLASPAAASFYRSRSVQAWLALSALEVVAVLSVWLATLVAAGERPALTFASAQLLDVRFDLTLRADGLTALFVLPVVFAGLANVMFHAARQQAGQYRGYYEPLLLLSLGIVLAAVASANLITLYVFWQLAIFCEALLLAAGPSHRSLAGVLKYLAANEAAALLLFFAIGLGYGRGASGDLAAWLGGGDESLRSAILALLVVAGVLGAASAPFHTWFSGAVEGGPPSFGSYLLATQNKIGLFLLARLVQESLAGGRADAAALYAALGALTVLMASAALLWRDERSTLAMIGAAQTGYVLLGFGTNERVGMTGALLLLLGQSLALALVWLSLEAVRVRSHADDPDERGALARATPLAAAAYIVGSLSLAGVPPLPGFAGQALVYRGLFATGDVWRQALVAVGLMGSLVTAVVLLRIGGRAFLGPRREGAAPRLSLGFADASLALLSLAVLAIGVLPGLVVGGVVAPVSGIRLLGGWGDLIYALQPGRAIILWSVSLTLVLCVLPVIAVALTRLGGRGSVAVVEDDRPTVTPGRLAAALSAEDSIVPVGDLGLVAGGRVSTWLAKASSWSLDPFDLGGRALGGVAAVATLVLRLTFRILLR